MLAPEHRLRKSIDFQAATRRGVRVSRSSLVVHVMGPAHRSGSANVTRIGFAVGKGVGGSVIRHSVARRLRAQSRELLELLPHGCTVVVRALPKSAYASSGRLGEELASALSSAASKLRR